MPGPQMETEMKWLNRTEVCAKTRLAYVSIWRRLKAGTFPRGYQVGPRILWKESEVDAWLEAQPRQRLKGDDGPRPASHANLRNLEPEAA